MEVTFSFLCDYAEPTGGKLHALGIGIDTVYAKNVPATHPVMYAVIALRFSSVEVGRKEVGIQLIDADGKSLIPPLERSLTVERPPTGYTYRTHRIALGLHGLTFPSYGDFSVCWLVNGQEVARLPLKVAPRIEPPPTV